MAWASEEAAAEVPRAGYAKYAVRHNGLAGNGAELLGKPFRKQELALKVRGELDR